MGLIRQGGAGTTGTPRPRSAHATGPRRPRAPHPSRPRRPADGERGSQTLELALVLPVAALFLVVLVQTAWLGGDFLLAANAARQGARVAAVSPDDRVVAAVRAVAGRPVDVRVDPPGSRRAGEPVTVAVRLPSAAFGGLGLQVWVPARATMLVEGP